MGSNSGQSPRGDASRLGEMQALRYRSDLPPPPQAGQSPPASCTSFLEPCRPPQALVLSARITPLLAPNSQNPLAEAGAGRGSCQGLVEGSQPPPAQLGPVWKGPPAWAAADLSLPRRPRVVAGLGAREGAAGAGPGYLQEESFGFGSPLLGPIQLSLPLPAAEKRKRLKRAPSRAPLRAALPGWLPRFPARRPSPASAPPPLPASQTHFCSKAAMSLESRMFSSGSQVLYLPSHTCRK